MTAEFGRMPVSLREVPDSIESTGLDVSSAPREDGSPLDRGRKYME